jgi:GNAT superfamily N-acetyltransferase
MNNQIMRKLLFKSLKYSNLPIYLSEMKIVDVSAAHEKQYFCCLEEWSADIQEAGDHKECWYAKMKGKGLRVKVAEDENGVACGMIQYLPVEISPVQGRDLYYVLCIWVHGHKKGIGNYQKKGLGKALLAAAEEDVRQLGGKGLVTWGMILPFFMRAAWFKKQGYAVTDKSGIMRLLWKPFLPDAEPPRYMKERKLPLPVPGKVNITVFYSGWCPVQNLAYERTKQAMIDFREKIVFNVYHTVNHEILSYWGIGDALFIDGKQIRTGPPISLKKIRRIIESRVRKLKEPVSY